MATWSLLQFLIESDLKGTKVGKLGIVTIFLFSIGCATKTPYYSGYSDKKVDEKNWLATFDGNQNVKPVEALRMASFRALEICQNDSNSEGWPKIWEIINGSLSNSYYTTDVYTNAAGYNAVTRSNKITMPTMKVLFSCMERYNVLDATLDIVPAEKAFQITGEYLSAIVVQNTISESTSGSNLQTGDVILRINKIRVTNMVDLQYELNRFKIEVPVTIIRQKTILDINVAVSNELPSVKEKFTEVIEEGCYYPRAFESPLCKGHPIQKDWLRKTFGY